MIGFSDCCYAVNCSLLVQYIVSFNKFDWPVQSCVAWHGMSRNRGVLSRPSLAVPCCLVLCCVMSPRAVSFRTVPCCLMPCRLVLSCSVLWRVVSCCLVPCCAMPHCLCVRALHSSSILSLSLLLAFIVLYFLFPVVYSSCFVFILHRQKNCSVFSSLILYFVFIVLQQAIYYNFELFRIREKQIPVDNLEMKGKIQVVLLSVVSPLSHP